MELNQKIENFFENKKYRQLSLAESHLYVYINYLLSKIEDSCTIDVKASSVLDIVDITGKELIKATNRLKELNMIDIYPFPISNMSAIYTFSVNSIYEKKNNTRIKIDASKPIFEQIEAKINELENDKIIDSADKIMSKKRMLVGFLKDYTPKFIEPYVLIWNIFAEENKRTKVAKITPLLMTQFNAILRVNGKFDIVSALSKYKHSSLLKQANWFTFNWLIKSADNHIKMIDGFYNETAPTPKNVNTDAENDKRKADFYQRIQQHPR